MKTIHYLLEKQFWAILFVLALIFFLATASGVTWGLPAVWHADEQLHQVMPALSNGLDALTLNVFYPTLPFFTMYAVGKVLSQLTAYDLHVMAGIRLISAMLGTLVISGYGIDGGQTLGKVRAVDVAPTIADLLGLEMPTADGKALTDAFETEK